jgi:hypothetical protein
MVDSFEKTESNAATNGAVELASQLDGAALDAASAQEWVWEYSKFDGDGFF